MKKIFDMNNPFMQALSTAADLLTLNLLTLLCSLPIVTAGAALAALNDLTIHLVRGEEGYIVRPFFRSFAANGKKGTLLWLPALAAAGLLYFDYLAALTYAPVFRVPIAAIAVLLLALAIYAFALLSRYENSVFQTLKNAAALMVAYFPRTLAMTAFAVALWALALRYYQFGIPVLLLFGLSLPCYVSARLMKSVFDKLDD